MKDHGKGILGRRDATFEEIGEAMGYAFREALKEHKRAGVPACTWDWENHRVVIVPPEEIVIPDEKDEAIEAEEKRPG